MTDRALQNFVNGKFTDASDGRTSDVIDPSTGEVYAQAPVSSRHDVDAAMQAAANAFEGWRDSTPSERSLALLRFADAMEKRAGDIVEAETRNTGKPVALTTSEEIPPAVDQIRFFAGAARVAASLVERLSTAPLKAPVMLNVNVPDLPEGQLLGLKVTRLGNRHRSERVVRAKDPRGRNVYWVGAAGAGQDAGPGTDFHAVAHGFASVTPLQIDLTRHAALPELERWLSS